MNLNIASEKVTYRSQLPTMVDATISGIVSASAQPGLSTASAM